MRVGIKRFDVNMEIKNTGIELEVRNPSGNRQIGDLVITKTELKWFKGKASKYGHPVTWSKFIQWMEQQSS